MFYGERVINTPDISAGQCTRLGERLFLGSAPAQMESALAFHDDDKYCIEQRRHAIFIVAAVERYGRREEIYLWHLEFLFSGAAGVSRLREKLTELYILCILRAPQIRVRARVHERAVPY